MSVILKCRISYRAVLKNFLLILLLLITVDLLIIKFFDSPKCFKDYSRLTYNYEQLEDVLLASERPPLGTSIFFIDSRCNQSKESLITKLTRKILPQSVSEANLSARQACAVESAALHNPNSTVFVLYATPSYFEKQRPRMKNVMDALMSYPNVRFRNVNLWTYTANTPVHNWILKEEIFKSSYIVEHVSDLLRLVTLWRWGGLYLDLDAITLRSMENLPPNYVGFEQGFRYIGNSVLNFSPNSIGHHAVTLFLQDFVSNYNGTEWGSNGPMLITRILSKICGTNHTKVMLNNPTRCCGINVLHPNAFFAVNWKFWPYFFMREKVEEMKAILNTSYVTHMWNLYSKKQFSKIGSNTFLDVLAKEHCPHVYSIQEQYNLYI